MMNKSTQDIRLVRRGDEVFVRLGGDGDETPVKLVWARPVSARGGEVCLMSRRPVGEGDTGGPAGAEEVLMLPSLDVLEPESRRVAEEELARRYLVPRITRVLRTSANFGVRYWHVHTTLGERRFALRHASKNALWVTDDHLVLRDTMGCRYEIRPYSALDAASRAEVEKVI